MRLESQTYSIEELIRYPYLPIPLEATNIEVAETEEGQIVVSYVMLARGDIPVEIGHC